MISNQDLTKIENIIKYKFKDKDLLKKCFLHSSLYKKNKNKDKNDNINNNKVCYQ